MHRGSFPSGHTVGVVLAFGLGVLLIRPAARWGWIVPAVMGAVMGWATDVAGAALLAAAALGCANAAGLGRWARGRVLAGSSAATVTSA